MDSPPGANDGERPRARARWPVQVSLGRVAIAAALLGGLFALLFFVLLPGTGRDGSVLAARMVDTPASSSDAELGVGEGQLARDFEASNMDGIRFRLSELRGRPVVINFWATWCTSCLAEMPVLEEQRKAHSQDDLAIIGVNVGEGPSAARNFIDALELFDLSIAMDTDLTIADSYAVRGLPKSVFIDRNGVIQAFYNGQLDDETMNRYVRAAIDAVPGGEAPFRIQLPANTVRREHVLKVVPDDDKPERVLFSSRRFRCDDSYCGEPVAELLREMAGVVNVQLRSGQAPPTLTVTFDPSASSLDKVVAMLADALRSHEDPLYTRELEIRYQDS